MTGKNLEILEIEDLDLIQNQCFSYISKVKQGNLDHRSGDNSRHSIRGDGKEISPILHKYLKENFKIMPNRFTFYVNIPESKIPPHIDGGGIQHLQDLSWYGLNIPIKNTENSVTSFYDVEPSNMQGRWPIDKSKKKLIESHTIVKPVIINTGVLHGVEHFDKDKTRYMLLIRWHPKYNFFKEVMNDPA